MDFKAPKHILTTAIAGQIIGAILFINALILLFIPTPVDHAMRLIKNNDLHSAEIAITLAPINKEIWQNYTQKIVQTNDDTLPQTTLATLQELPYTSGLSYRIWGLCFLCMAILSLCSSHYILDIKRNSTAQSHNRLTGVLRELLPNRKKSDIDQLTLTPNILIALWLGALILHAVTTLGIHIAQANESILPATTKIAIINFLNAQNIDISGLQDTPPFQSLIKNISTNLATILCFFIFYLAGQRKKYIDAAHMILHSLIAACAIALIILTPWTHIILPDHISWIGSPAITNTAPQPHSILSTMLQKEGLLPCTIITAGWLCLIIHMKDQIRKIRSHKPSIIAIILLIALPFSMIVPYEYELLQQILMWLGLTYIGFTIGTLHQPKKRRYHLQHF